MSMPRLSGKSVVSRAGEAYDARHSGKLEFRVT